MMMLDLIPERRIGEPVELLLCPGVRAGQGERPRSTTKRIVADLEVVTIRQEPGVNECTGRGGIEASAHQVLSTRTDLS
jgi:hypothetical protein